MSPTVQELAVTRTFEELRAINEHDVIKDHKLTQATGKTVIRVGQVKKTVEKTAAIEAELAKAAAEQAEADAKALAQAEIARKKAFAEAKAARFMPK